MKVQSSPVRERERSSLVNLSEITEVELLILKRMKEFTIGEHRSLFHGTGFDFVGLRDWAPGDRFSSIDWPQSSLTNFSPLIVREFEQPSTANVMVVADGSLSTRCGVDGVPIAAAIARAIATIGMSAVFFQDLFGMMMFETDLDHLAAIRPRIGKNQVIHCLEAYQTHRGLQDVKHGESLSRAIAGFMRKTSLIPVISDFLFERPEEEAVSIIDWKAPALPITGGALVDRGLRKGPDVATMLRAIEEQWVAEGFPDSARVTAIADAAVAQWLRASSKA